MLELVNEIVEILDKRFMIVKNDFKALEHYVAFMLFSKVIHILEKHNRNFIEHQFLPKGCSIV